MLPGSFDSVSHGAKKVVEWLIFEKCIKEATRDNLHDEYMVSDVRKMKLKKVSLDAVLASMVIERLPKEDRKNCKKARRSGCNDWGWTTCKQRAIINCRRMLS